MINKNNSNQVLPSLTDYTLQLVTARRCLQNISLEKAVEEGILGGVTMVQLREKDISTLEFYNLALKIKKVTDHYNIPLLINDRLDLALALDASGLHLGQDDLPAGLARNLLGQHKILGISASSLDEARKAEKEGANYLGVGAIFKTDTKKDTKYLSLADLKEITKEVNIPVLAIGGINLKNIEQLKDTGIKGLAIASALLSKKDIQDSAKELKSLFLT